MDDRVIQVKNRSFVIVFLRRKTACGLVEPKTLDLRVFTSSITLNRKVD